MPRKIQERLDAAEETLRALRSGEVDAIVASGPDGDRVYTLKGADEAYRLMIQSMEANFSLEKRIRPFGATVRAPSAMF